MAVGLRHQSVITRRWPAVAAVLLLAAIVVPALVSACGPVGADHLAAGKVALDEGRYADAAREFEAAFQEKSDPVIRSFLEEARSLAASEENYLAGLKAMAEFKYDEAAQYLEAVGVDHPKFAEAQAALVRLRIRTGLQEVAIRWGATLDPGTLTFTVTKTGLGSIILAPQAEQDPGGVELALTYVSAAGVQNECPVPLSTYLDGQCPVAIVGDERLIINGYLIWCPPAGPEPILLGTAGWVAGWAVDKAGLRLATCLCESHLDGPKTFDVYVVDLATMAGQRIACYPPGSSAPSEWYHADLIQMSWNEDGTLLYDSLAGASRTVERWTPGD